MDRYTHLQSADVTNALHELPEHPTTRGQLGELKVQDEAACKKMVAPIGVISWQVMAHSGMVLPEFKSAAKKQNPLPDKGFDAVCQHVTADDSSEADGTRTRNHRIDSRMLTAGKANNISFSNNDMRLRPVGDECHSAAECAAQTPENERFDPDLALVIDAWPTLPKSTQADILRRIRQ